ncbi:MAG TPA: serine hydrolase [Acidimicrobiales bacterium]|nr:serine hydrolase [Acidimicrobiales bacterium]
MDLLRTIALARVVLWHMFAATWMTAFAAMPLMFFVAGTLLVDDLGRVRSYSGLLARRGRRILVPLWAYGAAVLGATLVHAGEVGFPGSSGDWWRALTWIFPFVDPADSPWHGGWLANHLWYLRAYLWVLLLSPLLAAFSRRLLVAVPLFVLAIAQMEVASIFELPFLGDGDSRVVVGDLVTYGLFVVLGMAFRSRSAHRTPSPGGSFVLAVAAGGGAVWYATTVGLPPGGINASYPAIALTGLAWIGIAGVFERPLRRVAELRSVARFTRLVCRRAVTIYLWHPAAIVVAYAALGDNQQARPFALAGLTLVIAAVAAIGVGWMEETRAHRRLRLPTIRLAAVVTAAAVVLSVAVPALVVPTVDAAAASPSAVPPPSYRAALSNSAFSGGRLEPSKPVRLLGGRMPAKALQRALDEWTKAQSEVTSVAVGVTVDGKTWTGESHRAAAVTHDESRYAVASLTKTFTMALVMREIEAGRLGLDAPVPMLPGVGSPPGKAPITPRHLLQHTSGLVDYVHARGYRGDRPLTPQAAVALALRTRLANPPGTDVTYANVNYLYLGLLVEYVSGHSYPDLLTDLVAEARLRDTGLDAPGRPGWAGFSSGGVMSTVGDLSRWGNLLFTPGRVLPPRWVTALSTVDHTNLGLGTWPMCPCTTDAAGAKRYTAIGQHVGHGGLYHYPNGMTVAVHLEPASLQTHDQVAALGEALRNAFRR